MRSLPDIKIPSSAFHHTQTVAFVILFFSLRLLSFWLAPHLVLQGFFVCGLILVFAGATYRNEHIGWYMLVGELLLGGSGHFFELGGLAIRTLLIYTFLVIWIIRSLSNPDLRQRLIVPHRLFYMLLPVLLVAVFASVQGIVLGNELRAVAADIIPFSFFGLLLPAYHLLHDRHHMPKIVIRLFIAFVLGSALFALLNFVLFAGGFEILHGPYYNWYRDFAHGKITDMGNGFFRVVAPEHLLIVPALIITASLLMRDEKHHMLWRVMIILSGLVLAINFSRSYLIAIAISLLLLKYKHSVSKWMKESAFAVLTLFVLFVGLNLAGSGGHSFGTELIAGRFGGIADVSSEASTYTRSALLEPIYTKILEHPIAGNGLGSSVTFFEPVLGSTITTRQFDWGYLELLAELGMFGFTIFIIFLGYIVTELIRHIRAAHEYHDFHVGLLASVGAFGIMTIFMPAYFHVFGVLFLVSTLAVATQPVLFLDRFVDMLYSVFHKR